VTRTMESRALPGCSSRMIGHKRAESAFAETGEQEGPARKTAQCQPNVLYAGGMWARRMAVGDAR
jgi:hypothetical protein